MSPGPKPVPVLVDEDGDLIAARKPEGLPAFLRIPNPLVALLWGSQSSTRVRRSAIASEAPRLMAVVVFPTPPFWLAMEMIRLMRSSAGSTSGLQRLHIRSPAASAGGLASRIRPYRRVENS